MRVDTGIILSVLSFSVIAAVIPNGDDHAPLLVRRAVSSENGAVLWKRNNDDDQMDSDDSDSDSDTDTGTSGSGSSSNSPSRSRDQAIQARLKVLQWEPIHPPGSEVKTPFAPPPQRSKNPESLARELTRIQSAANELIEKCLKEIYKAIASILKRPQNVVNELEKVVSSGTDMFKSLISLCNDDYTSLASKMKDTNHKTYNQKAQAHVTQLKADQDKIAKIYEALKGKINGGVLKFKEKTYRKSQP
ncbi:hypothetical protein BASA83_012088 [Batrachochytrium salamandrivorans]|nr:hypothetical protein BASA83_012088 [Batrachochytrium salamandrivorans]